MTVKARATLASLAALLLTAVTFEALASNYPPDYNACGQMEMVSTGPFDVIRHVASIQHENVALTVAYDGYLRDFYPDNEINIYVRLNGHDAFVPASAGVNNDAYIHLSSGPRNCQCCWSSCDGPTATEEHLFFWALHGHYQVNAWDVFVAAESHGWWDSNFGANFYARFEPATCIF
jgi:hypothetical protein